MTAAEVIEKIEAAGGELAVHGDHVRYRIPANLRSVLLPELKAQKVEFIRLLKSRQVVQPSEMPVVYLEVPCTCREKSYPHFRHRDGSGPSSGRKLDAEDVRQAG